MQPAPLPLTPRDSELLEHFAHYVWWEERGWLIANAPLLVVARAMRDANSAESFALVCEFSGGLLTAALARAQAGKS